MADAVLAAKSGSKYLHSRGLMHGTKLAASKPSSYCSSVDSGTYARAAAFSLVEEDKWHLDARVHLYSWEEMVFIPFGEAT